MSKPWVVIERHRDLPMSDGSILPGVGMVFVGPFETQDEAVDYARWGQNWLKTIIDANVVELIKPPPAYSA